MKKKGLKTQRSALIDTFHNQIVLEIFPNYLILVIYFHFFFIVFIKLEMYSCKQKNIVLCIEVLSPHESSRKRRDLITHTMDDDDADERER